MKTVKIYTIREAIGELDAIRMESMTIGSMTTGTLADQNKELSARVAELASVTGWLARHIDRLEAGLFSDISFECDDGFVRKSEIFEVATLDGENAHPGMKHEE